MKTKTSLDKVYFLYFLILSSLVLFRIFSALGVFSIFGGYADYLFTFIIQVVVLFGFSVFGFSKLSKISSKDTLDLYKFNKISKKSIFLSIFLGIIVYFLNSYIASFFLYILSLFGYSNVSVMAIPENYTLGMLIVNIVFTAVLPGICEETAHRGMLLSQIKGRSVWKAVLISSLFFGLLHINIYQFFYASILGVFLALLTIYSDSIYPAMIVHFMNNAINVYMVYASVNNLFSAKLVGFIYALSNGQGILNLIFSLLFLMFLLFVLHLLFVEFVKEGAKQKIEKFQNGLQKFIARKIYFDDLAKIKNGEVLSEGCEIDLSIINQYFNQNCKKTDKKHKNGASFFSNMFFISSLVLSLVTTIFTFIWGII